MKIRPLLAGSAMLALGAQSGFAQGLTAGDLAFAFGDETVTEVARAPQPAPLSAEEMAETEGEVLPWLVATGVRAGYGAVSGGVSYSITNYRRSWSWRNFGGSVASGALGGTLGWNRPMSAVFGSAASAASNRWLW